MTLYTAFFTMEMERPALMSSTLAPSFWACFTEEFMNTVHREPRFTGVLGQQAQLGEVGDGVPQGLGEGLDKGAAAGGAGPR